MISVVIKTKNEIKTLPKLIAKLNLQTYKDFEIIIVDNESVDGTYEYAKDHAHKVMTIKQKEFSHARSCNLGIKVSEGEYVYFTNGHSLIISDKMLEDSNQILEANSKLAGLFGRAYPHLENHTLVEKLSSKFDSLLLPNHFKVFNKYVPYMQQTITCINRKKLLVENPYKEMKCGAGEDSLWAMEMLYKNYSFAYTPLLDVYHSHGGYNRDTLKKYWLNYKSTTEAKSKNKAYN